mmetsp:Transcript_32174/g.96968  ORF Transcript_32174/g.96968 Transcript_32174/m.96968 type:complete len:218 (+) Transcript_32174:7342-7995(+)
MVKRYGEPSSGILRNSSIFSFRTSSSVSIALPPSGASSAGTPPTSAKSSSVAMVSSYGGGRLPRVRSFISIPISSSARFDPVWGLDGRPGGGWGPCTSSGIPSSSLCWPVVESLESRRLWRLTAMEQVSSSDADPPIPMCRDLGGGSGGASSRISPETRRFAACSSVALLRRASTTWLRSNPIEVSTATSSSLTPSGACVSGSGPPSGASYGGGSVP